MYALPNILDYPRPGSPLETYAQGSPSLIEVTQGSGPLRAENRCWPRTRTACVLALMLTLDITSFGYHCSGQRHLCLPFDLHAMMNSIALAGPEVTTRMESVKTKGFTTPARLQGTNIFTYLFATFSRSIAYFAPLHLLCSHPRFALIHLRRPSCETHSTIPPVYRA
jgi:hypothetical protein